ncbi:hypothetical protein D9758_004841 [Tetrapyrgos nigripes]|uniref:Uncharacterized protein n=1 Tax=Tetrapyrgos nigripes TaxID=182062 RepID=A0A8H5G672_9AGAR|nr:hypothetical protein D9758_004841 [Tetrapyrgos nigripes]
MPIKRRSTFKAHLMTKHGLFVDPELCLVMIERPSRKPQDTTVKRKRTVKLESPIALPDISKLDLADAPYRFTDDNDNAEFLHDGTLYYNIPQPTTYPTPTPTGNNTYFIAPSPPSSTPDLSPSSSIRSTPAPPSPEFSESSWVHTPGTHHEYGQMKGFVDQTVLDHHQGQYHHHQQYHSYNYPMESATMVPHYFSGGQGYDVYAQNSYPWGFNYQSGGDVIA